MKEKLRGLLGFLGLVEDDYGDYGPSNTPRPFSEQAEESEPEWSPTPVRGRSHLSHPAGPVLGTSPHEPHALAHCAPDRSRYLRVPTA